MLRAESKGDALRVIATDPFFQHGITDGLTLTDWDPIFGRFAAEASGIEPPWEDKT